MAKYLMGIGKIISSVLTLILLMSVSGCVSSHQNLIDRDSVSIEQGKYNQESIDLIFQASQIGTADSIWVYFDKSDARFHYGKENHDEFTVVYEVLNPFGEQELKTSRAGFGPGKASLPFPVFWSADSPYEYTLRITVYIYARKVDQYVTRFRLIYPYSPVAEPSSQ